jgi:hypothetical protein
MNFNYKHESLLASTMALVFLVSAANHHQMPAVPVKVIAKDKRKEAEDEGFEFEPKAKRIGWKELRVGLERYNAKTQPCRARKDSMKRMVQRKLYKIRNQAHQEGLTLTYNIQ